MWPKTSQNTIQINHQAVSIIEAWEEKHNKDQNFPSEARGRKLLM
jgi:hypothetical protein